VLEPTSVRLFTGLAKNEVAEIMGAATKRMFESSEVIIRASEPATCLFLVKTGSVDFHVVTNEGRGILLRRLVPGDVFGVGAFLEKPLGYLGMAKSVRKSEVLAWEHTVVRRLAKAYPRLPENALRTVLRYIALYAERHIRFVSKPAEERLACVLTSLGTRAGRLLPSGMEIEIKNEDLASLADISFFTATRFLKAWERKGAVKKSRGKVIIRSPEKLVAA
jgi:CRP-like cAMP-binding protein